MSHQLFPSPRELARELTLAWLRVGYEALSLLAYVVKQNGSSDVSDSEDNMSKLHVYHIQNPPAKAIRYDVDGPAEGYRKIEALAAADLRNPAIWGNVIGLSVFEDGEWVDWYDDEGDDIDAWAEKKGLTT